MLGISIGNQRDAQKTREMEIRKRERERKKDPTKHVLIFTSCQFKHDSIAKSYYKMR